MSKSLEQQLQDLNVKFDDSVRNTQDLSSNKSRLEAENSELARQLHEVESQVRFDSRARSQTAAYVRIFSFRLGLQRTCYRVCAYFNKANTR